jgi:hypothetical protein
VEAPERQRIEPRWDIGFDDGAKARTKVGIGLRALTICVRRHALW